MSSYRSFEASKKRPRAGTAVTLFEQIEWVAAHYGVYPPSVVEHEMTVEQIALRYYLGHKDETKKLQQQMRMMAGIMGVKLSGR
jgi:hypothetical protein